MTYEDLIIGALREIGVLNAVDPPGAEDAALALAIANEILDDWNADEQYSYDDGFALFTLTANLQPHTIGIAANNPTFTVTGNRPVKIDGANIVINTVSPVVRTPLTIVDDQWWLDQPVRGVTSQIPTDLYYAPSWPNGAIYLWPVPTTAYQIELETRTVLGAVAMTDTVSLPPGYVKALRLTVAEQLAPAMRVAVSPQTTQAAMQARARIAANNRTIPRVATQDAGMPGGLGRPRASFNWLAGWPRS